MFGATRCFGFFHVMNFIALRHWNHYITTITFLYFTSPEVEMCYGASYSLSVHIYFVFYFECLLLWAIMLLLSKILSATILYENISLQDGRKLPANFHLLNLHGLHYNWYVQALRFWRKITETFFWFCSISTL